MALSIENVKIDDSRETWDKATRNNFIQVYSYPRSYKPVFYSDPDNRLGGNNQMVDDEPVEVESYICVKFRFKNLEVKTGNNPGEVAYHNVIYGPEWLIPSPFEMLLPNSQHTITQEVYNDFFALPSNEYKVFCYKLSTYLQKMKNPTLSGPPYKPFALRAILVPQEKEDFKLFFFFDYVFDPMDIVVNPLNPDWERFQINAMLGSVLPSPTTLTPSSIPPQYMTTGCGTNTHTEGALS